MSFPPHIARLQLSAGRRRRNHRLGQASVDVSADFEGRRTSGDLSLDLAHIDRHLRV
jgi:hypothetical protein